MMLKMSKDKIKGIKLERPCPFCGSKDVIIREPMVKPNKDCTIMCFNCGLNLMFYNGGKLRTIAMWNRAKR